MNDDDCAKIRDAIGTFRSNESSFCQGLADWADFFFATKKFSKWGYLGSHNHDFGGGAEDIIIMHYDVLEGSPENFAAALAHEIMHSDEWGIAHDTSPNNFELQMYCVNGEGPPPPPPPPGL
jgi:hypothetical protein